MQTSSDLESDALRVKLEHGVWRERFEMSLAAWTLASSELKPALLLTGHDLVAAESWLLASDGIFTQLERQFIAKSVMHASMRRTRERNTLAAEMHETVQRRLRLVLAMSIVALAIMAPGMFNYAVIRSMQEHAGEPQQVAAGSATPSSKAATIADAQKSARASEENDRRRKLETEARAAEAEEFAVKERQRQLPAVSLRLAQQGDARAALLVAIEAMDVSSAAQAAVTKVTVRPIITRPAGPTAAAVSATGVSAAATALVQAMSTSRDLVTGRGWNRMRASAVFCGGGRVVLAAIDTETVQAFDVATGGERLRLDSRPERLQAAAFSRDCSQVLLAAPEHYGEIWSLGTARRLAELKGHEADIVTSAFSPDGRRIVTGAQDGTLRLWDAQTARTATVLRGHTDIVLSASFSADGRRIVTASQDKTARVWDTASGRSLAVLEGHQGFVTSAAFSADGGQVLTTSWDGFAAVWSSTTGQRTTNLQTEGAAIMSAGFSPDGGQVATTALGPTAQIWDARSGQLRAELTDHSGPVRSLVFSPDGRWILTTSWGGEARLWQADGHRLAAVLGGADAPILAAAFGSDGQSAVGTAVTSAVTSALTLTGDGRLTTWPVFASTEEALHEARRTAPGCLSVAERKALGVPGDVPQWCTENGKAPPVAASLHGQN